MLLKAINFVLAAFFLMFAWLQRNDIDPEVYYNPSSLDSFLWFIFYFLIAAGFIWICFRGIPVWYFLIAAFSCLVEMAMSGSGLWENLFGDKSFTMTQVSMSSEDPRVELTREFFGAMLAFVAIVFQWWQVRRMHLVASSLG